MKRRRIVVAVWSVSGGSLHGIINCHFGAISWYDISFILQLIFIKGIDLLFVFIGVFGGVSLTSRQSVAVKHHIINLIVMEVKVKSPHWIALLKQQQKSVGHTAYVCWLNN